MRERILSPSPGLVTPRHWHSPFLVAGTTSRISKMHFRIVSFFWNGLFFLLELVANNRNLLQKTCKKKNVLEGYRAAHRVKGKADNRYHSRWTLSEVRGQRQQHHRHIQPQLSIQQISKWFWRSSLVQGPPLSQGTLMADCNWGGVEAVRVFLSEWREEKCHAGGSGRKMSTPIPFPSLSFSFCARWMFYEVLLSLSPIHTIYL